MTEHTPEDVARYMLRRLQETSYLYQEQIVYEIQSKFGERFTYTNENGNLAIDRLVLKEFRELSGEDVVWERSERLWRRRASYDPQDKRQVD